jgi:recombination protein RecA
MYGQGISREGSVLDLSVEEGIVKKSGAWYTYDGEQLGQGRENAKKYLTENPEVMVEISDRVWKAVMPEEEEAVADLSEDEEFSDADDLPIALEE